MNVAASLLIELLTEELPPKALRELSTAMAQALHAALQSLGLTQARHALDLKVFASPRRLAVWLPEVLAQLETRSGDPISFDMPRRVAFDGAGAPTPALLKRLEKLQCDPAQLLTSPAQFKDDKASFTLRPTLAGIDLQTALNETLPMVLANLPIPKMMSYQLADGETTVQFVRPAKHLLVLHGDQLLAVEALGLKADRQLFGHRFMAPQALLLDHADHYAERLQKDASVIADFERRRALLLASLQAEALALDAYLSDQTGARDDPDADPAVQSLLDEVCGLVEHPSVYVGSFEPEFLSVPKECLVLTMRQNQKYFPLFDAMGALTHRFLLVSNMQLADPGTIVSGNERVVRPRLADARFFFETDLKTSLYQRVDDLQAVVYHHKLGSQRDRVLRVQAIAGQIAQHLGADAVLAERAALLAKSDLLSAMVGEFPELQGVMGGYYARHDHEPVAVAAAIAAQYALKRSRHADDATDRVISALYIADRLETLVGMWGIGLVPTGDKDPYGLRRAAISLVHEWQSVQAANLPLPVALQIAFASFEGKAVLAATTVAELTAFVYERARQHLLQEGIDRRVADAVLQAQPPLEQIPARARAVQNFLALPAAEALAAAYKRIHNLLKKTHQQHPSIQADRLIEPAEQQLAADFDQLQPIIDAQLAKQDFEGALTTLATLRVPVDNFFNEVMVMSDDANLQTNRLALLASLDGLTRKIADLSKLAA